jgi:hypothetical protein
MQRVKFVKMFGPPKNKNGEEHRYYLLPGMGRANRKKRAQYLWWAIVSGLVFSGILALVLYLVNRRGAPLFGGE